MTQAEAPAATARAPGGDDAELASYTSGFMIGWEFVCECPLTSRTRAGSCGGICQAGSDSDSGE